MKNITLASLLNCKFQIVDAILQADATNSSSPSHSNSISTSVTSLTPVQVSESSTSAVSTESPAKKRAIDFSLVANSSPVRSTVQPALELPTSPITEVPPVPLFEENSLYEDLLSESVETFDDPKDTTYNPNLDRMDETNLGEWSQFISNNEDCDIQSEKKYVVTEGQLMKLLNRIPCPDCASPPEKILTTSVGTCLKAKTICSCGSPILD